MERARIFKSEYPPLDIPNTAYAPFVLRKEGPLRDKTALIDAASGQSLTYRELWSSALRAARGLHELGFRRGDVLAIWSPNGLEYPIAFHAAGLLGGSATTLNPLATAGEAHKQLASSRARLCVTTGALFERAREAALDTAVEALITFDGVPGSIPFAKLLEEREFEGQVELDPRTSVVALPYSSGTTGLPKAVMLSHRSLVANALQLSACGQVQESDVLVCVLPMFHIYGLSVILGQGLSMGCTIVVVPRFELESFLHTLAAQRVTFGHFVPPIVLQLAKHPSVERYDLSHLRMVFSGAAPLSTELTAECEKRLGFELKQGYGMTESGPATHSSPLERARTKPGAAGGLLPNTEAVIVDPESGRTLGTNERGELWVRGPQVMLGYLDQPEATANTLDQDGWLHTGDIGYVDDDGQLFIVDRLKELIKVKGFQVAPAELEALLLTHPAVLDAAVIGISDEESGEVPKAFVVLRAPLECAELQAFVAARVSPYKRLRQIEIVNEIPKSPSGKILRRVLVERERAASIGAQRQPERVQHDDQR